MKIMTLYLQLVKTPEIMASAHYCHIIRNMINICTKADPTIKLIQAVSVTNGCAALSGSALKGYTTVTPTRPAGSCFTVPQVLERLRTPPHIQGSHPGTSCELICISNYHRLHIKMYSINKSNSIAMTASISKE